MTYYETLENCLFQTELHPWNVLIEAAFGHIENFRNQTGKPWAFDQIKEKYGTLRLYTDYFYEDASPYIDRLERLSGSVCENCGRPGVSVGGGWVTTLCGFCAVGKTLPVKDRHEPVRQMQPETTRILTMLTRVLTELNLEDATVKAHKLGWSEQEAHEAFSLYRIADIYRAYSDD